MKVDTSAPGEVEVFKELQERPGEILEMVRLEMPKAVGDYLSEMMKVELTRFLGWRPYERAEDSDHRMHHTGAALL